MWLVTRPLHHKNSNEWSNALIALDTKLRPQIESSPQSHASGPLEGLGYWPQPETQELECSAQWRTLKRMLSKPNCLTICGPTKIANYSSCHQTSYGWNPNLLVFEIMPKGSRWRRSKFHSIWHQKPEVKFRYTDLLPPWSWPCFSSSLGLHFLLVQCSLTSHSWGEKVPWHVWKFVLCSDGHGNMSCLWGQEWGPELLGGQPRVTQLLKLVKAWAKNPSLFTHICKLSFERNAKSTLN